MNVGDTAQTSTAPEIWALASYRAGETSQILALAAALAEATGSAWRRIDLDYRKPAALCGLLKLTTRLGTSTPLAPPWPRILISAGLRNEPICRWIRRSSGNYTRLVFLGRTWAAVPRFDLVVTTPQYRLKAQPYLRQNPLTLHGVNTATLENAQKKWAHRFGERSERQVGVLLGGASGPYRFDRRYARRLAAELEGFAAGERLRYLITTSSRTPKGFAEELEQHLKVAHDFYRWPTGDDNPYLGILAWSDVLIVSADSIAMISEAVATGKRVLLTEPTFGSSPGARLYALAMRWGHRRLTRDVALIHHELRRLGVAQRLDTVTAQDVWSSPARGAAGRTPDYQAETIAKVSELFA